MIIFKRAISLMLILGLLIAAIGCSNSQKQTATASTQSTPTSSQDPNIKVIAQFQGNYDEELNKLRTAQQSKSGPDIVQVYDIGTRFMVDSGWAVPVQKFIDEEKYDISKLEPNLLAYYTVENKLYSMPFNSSTPILYYNKTAFKDAGLNPDTPPKNFEEIEQYGKKLLKKDASGKVTQYGYSMAIYGWFFEQFMAKQGALYANNGNGRDARATAVVFNDEAGQNIVNWWKKLVDEGVAGNFGRGYDDTLNAFTAGRTAMFIASTASLKQVLDGVGNKFEVGTGFLPALNDSKDGGVIIGGASLWILNTRSEEYQKAAWEFIKYMVSPEQPMICRR
jgi:sn-glycerol 3-phosphate transport system substrate-binding protein